MPRKDRSRRVPSQSRSRELVAVIEEAGLRVLQEEGPQALTTKRVAERAGVSVGSLYQYFKNKQDVLEAVYRRQNEEFWDEAVAWIPRLAAMSLQQAIDLIVKVTIRRHRELYELHPEFFVKEAMRYSLSTFNEEAHERATKWVAMILECHRDALAIDSPDRAAYLLTRTLGGLLVRTCRERPRYLMEPSFEIDLQRMLRGLLVDSSREKT
ncbi:MAG: TetR/AcrR family transcriptional regulator [Proteobacteria bacterium]|nr:TetR/AcrR family transcriptional regulator [Pseudomonadota bacterium]